MGTEADEARSRERTTRSAEHIEGRVTLMTIGQGMAQPLFNRELEAVLANMLDPNTAARANREIVMKFKFKPSEKRDMAAVLIEATSKLATVNPAGGAIFVGRVNKKIVAVEENPRQRKLFDAPTPVVQPLNGGGEEGE